MYIYFQYGTFFIYTVCIENNAYMYTYIYLNQEPKADMRTQNISIQANNQVKDKSSLKLKSDIMHVSLTRNLIRLEKESQ